MSLAIGVDLGGTNLRLALVERGGKILAERRGPTSVHEGPESCANRIATFAKELSTHSNLKILGIGIGSPGPLSRQNKLIFQTPNLPGFDGFPLGKKVEELSGFSTHLDNDAKCAAFGELSFGAAKGAKDFVLLTFGTGIGGAVIAGGQMIYGKSDGACEIGHMTLYPEGKLCGCGNRGCFEQYVSATALERRSEEFSKRKISNVTLVQDAVQKDHLALTVLEAFSTDLAIGCASLVNIFEPEKIIFGGGLFTSGGGPICEMVKAKMKDRCFVSSQKGLEILPSALSGEAGVLGAASLVFSAKS